MPNLAKRTPDTYPLKKGGCLSDLNCQSRVSGQHEFGLSEWLSGLMLFNEF
jgi:hypothetical protein